MSDNNTILEIKDLYVDFETDDGVVHAVNGMNLELQRGRSLGLVGETGAGKTTTALSVLRLIPDPPGVIRGGSITIDGKDLLSLPIKEVRKLRGNFVSMIFQDPMTSLNPTLQVGEQIAEVLRAHDKKLSKSESLKRAADMLKLVGIAEDRISDYTHQFSGGMRQRVDIAIALACNPQLLIADEPTTALDVTIQAQILEVMKELRQKLGTSLIMITHDLGIVAEICDDVSVMYGGRVVEHGSLEDVFNDTKHPYTEGLFNSLPNINNRTSMLKPIPGLMLDPTESPAGCPFAPRCAYATDKCFEEKPPRFDFNETHYAECHRYSEEGFRLNGRDN